MGENDGFAKTVSELAAAISEEKQDFVWVYFAISVEVRNASRRIDEACLNAG